MSSTGQAPQQAENADHNEHPSVFRRSIQAVFSPFSPAALALLPRLARPARYTRADAIPETQPDSEGHQPTVRDYHAINLPPQVRVPKKVPTPIRVEGKVWFANERTWVSWLNIAVVLATLSLALFNASKDEVATYFAYTYAIISICVLIYGWAIYQYRINMIRRRDPGHFDNFWGPIILSIALFFAVLANFIIRVRELRRKGVPIPGAGLFGFANPANQTIPTVLGQQQRPF
ncbi:Vacuolar transporter chaperone 2 [Leucoagaricus sp. SymC.cos]|nr:Vacuolar transporter chaperone 2 [Leucoagaricus sp. SymC.cos]